ncbi:MAG: hypothetical protein QXM68_01875 [Candidatus Aenigmatarchaeota archaeon]|nr:hypothetical protein [Candidatus Aenigmarchaeota archaeon]
MNYGYAAAYRKGDTLVVIPEYIKKPYPFKVTIVSKPPFYLHEAIKTPFYSTLIKNGVELIIPNGNFELLIRILIENGYVKACLNEEEQRIFNEIARKLFEDPINAPSFL